MPPTANPRGPGHGLALTLPAALLLLGLLLLLPHLAEVDFHREEGRRVLPAREMLASGDFVTPTLWGEPYLSKPPGIFWLQALAQTLAGGVGTFSARLVSVLATLLTTLALWAFTRRELGQRAGLYAGLSFLLLPEVMTKGRLAEIEAPLGLFVFLALAGWWWARERSWGFVLPAGLALAAALLLKGPAALVFVLGPPLLLALARREPRLLLCPRLLIVLLLGAGLASLWVVALFDSVGAETARSAWGSQVTGQGGRTLAAYATERGKFFFGVVMAAAPASFVLLAAGRRSLATDPRGADARALALAVVVAGLVFFALFPGTSVRYLYPALPFTALLAGGVVARALSGEDALLARRLGKLAAGLGVVGALLVVALLVGSVTPLGDVRVNAFGLLLAGAMAVVVAVLWRARPETRLLAALFAVPWLLGQVLTSQVDTAKAARHSRAPFAAELDARLEPGEVLHVPFWKNFNTLLYLEHEVHWAPDWRGLPVPGAWLCTASQAAELEREHPHLRLAADPYPFQVRRSSLVFLRVLDLGPQEPRERGWGG